jgi:hypothetical protein
VARGRQGTDRRHPRSRDADVRRAARPHLRRGRARSARSRVRSLRSAHRRRRPGARRCRAFAPDVVGLQCNFTTERFRTLRLARRVRREMPQAFVVVGGHDASREPAVVRHPAFDAIAVGDGEEVMPPLVEALDRGGDLRDRPGLVLNRDGGQVATGHAPARRELDTLPLPARHLIAATPALLHQLPQAASPDGDGARLPLQVQFLLGMEVPREHLPRKVAGAGGRGAAGRSRRPTSSSPTTSSG